MVSWDNAGPTQKLLKRGTKNIRPPSFSRIFDGGKHENMVKDGMPHHTQEKRIKD